MSNKASARRGCTPRLIYVRPDRPPSLGLAYRDACNTTGRCPGCDVVVELEKRDGVTHVYYRHADGCPALLEGER